MARRAAWVDGQAPAWPTPAPLGERRPRPGTRQGPTTGTTKKPTTASDAADHERAGGDGGLEPASGHGVLDDRAGHQAARRDGEGRPGLAVPSRWPRPGCRRRPGPCRAAPAPRSRTGPTTTSSAQTSTDRAHRAKPSTRLGRASTRAGTTEAPDLSVRGLRALPVAEPEVGQSARRRCDRSGVSASLSVSSTTCGGDLAELVTVLAGVVGAEQQLAAATGARPAGRPGLRNGHSGPRRSAAELGATAVVTSASFPHRSGVGLNVAGVGTFPEPPGRRVVRHLIQSR